MCGITGFFSHDGDIDGLARDLARAVECLRHRGPDDDGMWVSPGGAGLGHRRLSIIDLSERAHQPMKSQDGRLYMVFNGEIYNYAEIRESLLALGHPLHGAGDTEVILASFQEWGVEAIERFIGMFAIAVWDERDRILHLIRDRVGVKPLYYGWDGHTLWFGSELKALREFHHWQPRIDRESLGEFLQYGYISAPRSIYHNVRSVPPGCRIELRAGEAPRVVPYWSLVERAGEPLPGDDATLEAELESLLTSAFRYRMVADVPVGVFLSGGVDSSLVTAILARESSQPLRTFTIGFNDAHRDESGWARKVAEHLGTQHTEYILEVEEALKLARDWGSLFDEPFADPSGLPTLLVSRLARADVKVALSADGGDELFMGYSVYDDVLRRLDTLARVPGWGKTASAYLLAHARTDAVDAALSRLGGSAAVRGQVTRRIRRTRAIMPRASVSGVYDAAISYWLPEEVAELIGGYSNPRQGLDAYRGEPLEEMCLWDFHNYLPGDVLTKVDRTTMAVSLEGREPMLDHRLVEFAFRLPSRLRRGPLGSKHVLKKILYRRVPRALVDRPKQGFAIPLERWLRGDLRDLVNDHLDESRIRSAGIFDPGIVRRLVDDFYLGNGRSAEQLWFLLAFELWRETWGAGAGE
ncbi:MAG TPA: asparagine synthase (glutamine-hydrolyzing) [Candidatus Krumholzibacteria bacterium]|nr:asparagine synthase (glutamine-hydrolyzing) [Candidatus Krumholzibacteria bacterium]